MQRYKGTVIATFTQDFEIEAESQDEAEATMRDYFDPARCTFAAEIEVFSEKVESQTVEGRP